NWLQRNPQIVPPAIPAGRYQHAMAFDAARGEVVLFAGYNDVTDFQDTWVWNGLNWSNRTAQVITSANTPEPRRGQAMVYDASRRVVLLFGGYSGVNSLLQDTWSWNGTNWSLTAQSGPTARQTHGMA